MTQARTTDPPTSHLAAEQAEKTIAPAQRKVCLCEIVWRPGQTSAEIADSTGLERHAPARRMKELEKAGMVHKGDKRACRVVGSMCVTYWPGPKPSGQLELF